MPSYSEILNHEHYKDPTAYEAIKRVGEEEKMNVGDIYLSDYGKMYVVVATTAGKISIVIQLTDDAVHPMCILSSRGAKFYNPAYVSYFFNDKLVEYVCKASDTEVREMKEAVGNALGLSLSTETKEVVKEVIKEVPRDTSSELVEARTELKIYKELYEKLLGKVVS